MEQQKKIVTVAKDPFSLAINVPAFVDPSESQEAGFATITLNDEVLKNYERLVARCVNEDRDYAYGHGDNVEWPASDKPVISKVCAYRSGLVEWLRTPVNSGRDDSPRSLLTESQKVSDLMALFRQREAAGDKSQKVENYTQDFVTLQTRQAETIETLAAEIGSINEDAHLGLVDLMKGALSAGAANDGGDNDAEDALESAEEWVADNVSNGGIEADVAMALYLYGDKEGAMFLRANKEKVGEQPAMR